MNWTNNHPNIDNPCKSKYWLLTFKREEIGTRNFKDLRIFIEYMSNMNYVYPNIDDCTPKRTKTFTLFD